VKPRKERRGHYTAPKTNGSLRIYLVLFFLQPLGNGTNGEVKSRRDGDRRCADRRRQPLLRLKWG
jgi:hypothetical protein